MGSTDDLIAQLSAEPVPSGPGMEQVWRVALLAAVVVAAVVFTLVVQPRADIAAVVVSDVRFGFKFVVTLALAVTSIPLLKRLATPGAQAPGLAVLAVAPALLAIALIAEMAIVPYTQWPETAVGSNSLVCLTMVPLLGAGPLIAFLVALRRGAVTRPVLAGSIAGIAAGAIAATFYAAHCTDDSPLFVVVWYPIAIAILAAAGAIAGRMTLRW